MNHTAHLSDLLTITTGKLLSTRYLQGIQELLEILVAGPVMTHEIPDAINTFRPIVLSWYPELENITVPIFINNEEGFEWIAEQCVKYGTWFDVWPIPDIWTSNPLFFKE